MFWGIRAAALLLAVGLAACEQTAWGEPAEEPSLTMTLSPSPLTAELYPYEVSAFTVQGTIKGTLTTSPVYLRVYERGDVFAHDWPADIYWSSPTTFTAFLYAKYAPKVGPHTSSLDLRMCADFECAEVLATQTLPYSITVKTPRLLAVGEPNEALGGVPGGVVPVGVVIEGLGLQGAHVRVRTGDGVIEAGGPWFVAASGFNYVVAALPLAASIEGKRHEGTVEVEACADLSCEISFGVVDFDYRVQVFETFASTQVPTDLALDSAGDLWVTGFSDASRLHRITPAGDVSTPFTANPDEGDPYLMTLAIDASDTIYFGGHGGLLRRTPGGEVAAFPAPEPTSVTTDASGNVWSVNFSGDNIVKQSPDATILRNEFFRADACIASIVVHSAYAYVASFDGIWRVAPDGGQLRVNTLFVNDLVREPSGRFLTAATWGGIQRFDLNGLVWPIAPTTVLLGDGSWDPRALALTADGKTLYVADTYRNLILRTELSPSP